MALHFLQGLLKNLTPSVLYTRILTWTTRTRLPISSTTRQDLNTKITLTRGNINPNPSTNLSHLQRKTSPPEPQPQASSDPVFYREVDINDLPSQYTEEVETFRQIRDLPDPRETLPRSSTTVLGLDDEKGQQELRPRGPSAMLPLSPILKDAFEKFEQDFLASNLP